MAIRVSTPALSSEEPFSRSTKIWLMIGFLTILWHLLIFSIPWDSFFLKKVDHSPVRVESIDSQSLEEIRNQWKKRQLLLNPNSDQSQETAPQDARFFSDKNVKVDKEQRARQTDVLPRPHRGSTNSSTSQAQSQTQNSTQQSRQRMDTFPKLGNLGIPLNLSSKRPQPSRTFTAGQSSQSGQAGADQTLDEKQLPEGDINILNTEKSIYFSYYSRLYEAVGPIWKSRIREILANTQMAKRDYVTHVDVVFDHAGNLVDIIFIQSSGSSYLDEAVVYSWKKVGGSPNPPKDLIGKDGLIHTTWTFTVHSGP